MKGATIQLKTNPKENVMDKILTERESRLAVVLFEMLTPQIEKMIDEKLDGFKESEFDLSLIHI